MTPQTATVVYFLTVAFTAGLLAGVAFFAAALLFSRRPAYRLARPAGWTALIVSLVGLLIVGLTPVSPFSGAIAGALLLLFIVVFWGFAPGVRRKGTAR